MEVYPAWWTNIAMERSTMLLMGKYPLFLWPCSIAMLVITRVYTLKLWNGQSMLKRSHCMMIMHLSMQDLDGSGPSETWCLHIQLLNMLVALPIEFLQNVSDLWHASRWMHQDWSKPKSKMKSCEQWGLIGRGFFDSTPWNQIACHLIPVRLSLFCTHLV